MPESGKKSKIEIAEEFCKLARKLSITVKIIVDTTAFFVVP